VIDWNIGQIISEIESVANIIIGTDAIRMSLRQAPNTLTPAERIELHNDAQKILVNLVNNKSYIQKMFIGNSEVAFTQGSTWELHEKELTFDQLAIWYPMILEAGGAGLWIKPASEQSDTGEILYYFQLLKDLNTLEEIGILAISIHNSVFDRMLDSTAGDSLGDVVVLGDNQMLYRKSFTSSQLNGEELMRELLQESNPTNGIQQIGDNSYFASYINSKHTGWRIVSLISQEAFMKESEEIRNTSLQFMLVAFLVMVLVAVVVSNGITAKLKKLMRAIWNWEKNRGFDQIQFTSNSEIDIIGNEFMRIARENETLNKKLYESTIKEKEAELLALQSQINPHFLYNTLNAIFWMAQNMKAEKIARMVVSLSRFFQLSLNNGDKITTIENEMEQMIHYMDIQNTRYNNRFEVTVDMPEELMKARVIKLLIQPLVENCINHGLEPKVGSGSITISSQEDNDAIYIRVTDDGVGFDPGSAASQRGYALRNIDERIKLFYGPSYGVLIDSSLGEGTTVTLRLGKIEGMTKAVTA
jgi:two-component system sensor histidine kinase YesM